MLVVTFLLSGCTHLEERRAIKKCRFQIAKTDIVSFSLSSLSLELVIEIFNPQEIRAVLDRMDLVLSIEKNSVATINFEPVTVPPKCTRRVRAVVEIPFSSLGIRVVDSMKRGGRVRYRLSGHAYVKTSLGISKIPVTVVQN